MDKPTTKSMEQQNIGISRLFLLVGRTGVTTCWILNASMSERTSSFPLATNNFKTLSFNFPALKVSCFMKVFHLLSNSKVLASKKDSNMKCSKKKKISSGEAIISIQFPFLYCYKITLTNS